LVVVGAGRRALRVWLGALLVAAAADLVTGGAIRDTVARTVGDWVIEQRAALALTGIVMFLDHPVVGVGPGGFAPGLDQYGALVPGLEDLKPTPHNAYVQAAAETGGAGPSGPAGRLGRLRRPPGAEPPAGRPVVHGHRGGRGDGDLAPGPRLR
jgi:O-antigen ligase